MLLKYKEASKFTDDIEVIFVEGNSSDGTWEEINKVIKIYNKKTRSLRLKLINNLQKGKQMLYFML